MSKIPTRVTLVEVGPRDGLQNEPTPVSTAQKIELVHRLQQAGLTELEVAAFVSPKWVPQMADAYDVLAGFWRSVGQRYHVLVPNVQGLERARHQHPDEVVVFGAATEAFSQRNINCSIADSIARFEPVVQMAHDNGFKVRGAISCALGCPYQGDVSPDEVERVVVLMKGIGVDHCNVADTIGTGNPRLTQAVMERALKHYPLEEVSGHFHDTYGQALSNILACLQMGIARFDTSVAGLGGCPYAKGATGNVATEDVLYMLRGMGIDTGVDLDRLVDVGAWISGIVGRPPASGVARAMLAKKAAAAAAVA